MFKDTTCSSLLLTKGDLPATGLHIPVAKHQASHWLGPDSTPPFLPAAPRAPSSPNILTAPITRRLLLREDGLPSTSQGHNQLWPFPTVSCCLLCSLNVNSNFLFSYCLNLIKRNDFSFTELSEQLYKWALTELFRCFHAITFHCFQNSLICIWSPSLKKRLRLKG